jgi:hypothetical protein
MTCSNPFPERAHVSKAAKVEHCLADVQAEKARVGGWRQCSPLLKVNASHKPEASPAKGGRTRRTSFGASRANYKSD